MDLSAQALQDFEADLLAAANARGVSLSPADVQEVFDLTVAAGRFDPVMMRAQLDSMLVAQGWTPDDDEPDYEDPDDFEDAEPNPGHERLARDIQDQQAVLADRLGRPLTARESDRLIDAGIAQAERGYQKVDLVSAHEAHEEKMGTPGGRAEFYRERLGQQAAEANAERVEAMVEGRSFDLDDDHDRRDYMAARMAGVQFEDSGASWEDD